VIYGLFFVSLRGGSWEGRKGEDEGK